MNKITKYVLVDLLRNKSIILYTILLFLLSISVYNMEDNFEKGIISLLNIVLFIVPLVSIIFSSIYIYSSVDFINLLVSQPLKRKNIWLSIFKGLATTLCLASCIGIGVPTLIFAFSPVGLILVATAVFLSFIFVSLAMWASVMIQDKSKGIGFAILLWLYFGLLFDALVLFILFQFSDYPIESVMIGLTLLNPIDISRILILLQLDMSALLGYTGAIFRAFFGTSLGMGITLIIMLLWGLIPLWFSSRHFEKKDL